MPSTHPNALIKITFKTPTVVPRLVATLAVCQGKDKSLDREAKANFAPEGMSKRQQAVFARVLNGKLPLLYIELPAFLVCLNARV